MSFNPDQFLADTDTKTAAAPSSATSFDPDQFLKETEGHSVGGFAKNAWEDVKGNVAGLAQLGKGLVTHPIDTVAAIPGGLVEEGKRIGIGELATGHPINAMKKFGQAVYDKPLSTGLDVSALYGLGEGVAGKLAKVPKTVPLAEAGTKALGAAETAAPAIEGAERVAGSAPAPISLPGEASDILKAPIPEAAPPPVPETGLSGIASKLSEKIPGEIKAPLGEVENFLTNKYGQVAKRPGFANTMADYLKEHSQNMTLKELGASPGQVRKIGIDRARALADYAQEHGLVGPSVGSIGRETALKSRLGEAGGAVGGLRKMAADRGAIHDVEGLVSQIKSQLDQKYLSGGINSGGKRLYLQAIDELKKAGPRVDNVAEKVSDMFKEAKNLDVLKKPSGPIADVARVARMANDNLIEMKLVPEEAAAYGHALEDYGALKQLNEFAKRRSSTEAGGRLGPGSGISRMMVQKFLDSVGYRVESQVASKLADIIRRHPEIAQSPKNVFRNLVDEYSEAIDDMGDVAQ